MKQTTIIAALIVLAVILACTMVASALTTNSNSTGSIVRITPTPMPAPPKAPSGAKALCGDGTHSYSAQRSGTCAGHGGVATWM